MDLASAVRAIPDHPKPGIVFRDVTPLMGDPVAFEHTIRLLAEAFKTRGVDKVAGIEARGFVFGAALADRLNAGFVPIRKLGKLPAETIRRSYTLEYGEDTLEVHKDALTAGQRVLLIDDLLATGGTAAAGLELLRAVSGELVAAAFVIELLGLPGRATLEAMGAEVFALMTFEG